VLQRFALYDEGAATNERGWKAFAEPVLALRGLIAAPVSHGLLQQHQHCSLLFPITVLLQSVLFGWLWVNIFASTLEDVLHQDFNGLGKHLLECIYIEHQTKAEASRWA